MSHDLNKAIKDTEKTLEKQQIQTRITSLQTLPPTAERQKEITELKARLKALNDNP